MLVPNLVMRKVISSNQHLGGVSRNLEPDILPQNRCAIISESWISIYLIYIPFGIHLYILEVIWGSFGWSLLLSPPEYPLKTCSTTRKTKQSRTKEKKKKKRSYLPHKKVHYTNIFYILFCLKTMD